MRIALVSSVLTALSLSAPMTADEPQPFFNGKDLAGFEYLDKYWSIKDGAIVGSTEPDGIKFNTFLCSKKQYGDFELKFKVRLKGATANSGVQVRSEVFDREKLAVKGPQCDMGQQYWGSLYGEHFGGMMKQSDAALVKKVLKDQEFNDYEIRCLRKHVTIKLNGETTVAGEFATMPDRGIIAFQIHGGGAMEVTFKDIVFKELR